MATPEAVFLQRLAQARPLGSQEQEPIGIGLDRFLFGEERTQRIQERKRGNLETLDSLRSVLDTISGPSSEEVQEAFFSNLGILHEQDPEGYPAPDRIDLEMFLAGSGKGGTPEQRRNLLDLWVSTKASLESSVDSRRNALKAEMMREESRGIAGIFGEAGGGILDRVLQLDQFIREVDPTAPAREKVREAPGVLGELLKAAGSRVGEGAVAAKETLGQGATDLEFLLRQFVLEEILAEGDAAFPEQNPRAVRAEQFAGRRSRDRGEPSRRRR